MMNRNHLDAFLTNRDACPPALDWLATVPSLSPEELWRVCPVGDWMLWIAVEAGVPASVLEPVAYAAADRAVREYAPAALDAAGLHEQADMLRALAPVVDADTADAADAAAYAAADAAEAAEAARAACAVYAADAADAAAESAGHAADAADAAARAAGHAADAADAAARAAGYAERAERARCADDCRRLVPWEAVEAALAKAATA